MISALWFHFTSLDLKNGCNRYQMIELNCTNICEKCSETIIEEFTRHITLIYQHMVFYATLISRWRPQLIVDTLSYIIHDQNERSIPQITEITTQYHVRRGGHIM
jgi:hypothetical protein